MTLSSDPVFVRLVPFLKGRGVGLIKVRIQKEEDHKRGRSGRFGEVHNSIGSLRS